MSRSLKQIIPGTLLGTSAAALYTAPAGAVCVVSRLALTNTSASNTTVTLYLVPSGGTAQASNIIASARPLAAGETWSVPDVEGHVIPAGGSIQALAGTADVVAAIGSGQEVV